MSDSENSVPGGGGGGTSKNTSDDNVQPPGLGKCTS